MTKRVLEREHCCDTSDPGQEESALFRFAKGQTRTVAFISALHHLARYERHLSTFGLTCE